MIHGVSSLQNVFKYPHQRHIQPNRPSPRSWVTLKGWYRAFLFERQTLYDAPNPQTWKITPCSAALELNNAFYIHDAVEGVACGLRSPIL
jgi:hypothetical protein